MLSKSMFSQEYIRQLHAWTGYDPQLLERVIYAFGLLEAIKLAGLPFCFKGGTSMLLLLDHPRRLSTDIDIIVEPNTDIDEYISYAGTIFPFERVVETHRAVKGSLQKRHFRFTYKSPENGRDVTILLDVLFENILYETVKEYPIRNELLITDGEDLSVLAPNANGLLADKLTAFAPHTTGIPLGIGKDLEVIKQLFDCGVLFEAMDNFHEVCSSYERIAKTEILYRDLKIQPEDTQPVGAFQILSVEDDSPGVLDADRRTAYPELAVCPWQNFIGQDHFRIAPLFEIGTGRDPDIGNRTVHQNIAAVDFLREKRSSALSDVFDDQPVLPIGFEVPG